MISAIVYTSETGSCAKYAGLLSEALHIPAKSLKSAFVPEGSEVIYIGWLMNGSVTGLKQAQKKFDIAAVVQVGMAPVNAESEKKGREKNEVADTVAYFCKQGAFHMSRLPLPFRLIMKIINAKTVKSLSGKTDLDGQHAAVYTMASTGDGDPADWDISDIVAWANK